MKNGHGMNGIPELSGTQKASILILADFHKNHAGTVIDHVRGFLDLSLHNVHVYNPRGIPRSWFLDLDTFDVVVIHYSLVIISDGYLSPHFREQIRAYRGLKIQFIQDDYRWVNEISSMINYLGIDILYTLYPAPMIPRIWRGLPDVEIHSTLAGYVSEKLMAIPTPAIAERPIDVGYRGRTLPFWLGRLAQEKVQIGQGFLDRAPAYGLKCDIAWREEDRIYGPDWIRFISSCRATLGTESGASIADFDSSIERRTREYLKANPNADFEEVHDTLLTEYEDNARINVVSPRVFEAIALRTPLVLFPGEYSGTIVPWRHYIPLEKDFSNMGEVAKKIKDTPYLEDLAERAYEEVGKCEAYSYRHMIKLFDELVTKHFASHARGGRARYRLAKIESDLVRAMARTVQGTNVVCRTVWCWNKIRDAFQFTLGLLCLSAPRPEIRRLIWLLFKHEKSLTLPALPVIVKDFLLMGIVARANRPAWSVENGYRITASESASGLLLRSFPLEQDDPVILVDQSAAVELGSAPDIVWDHSLIADTVEFRVGRWCKVCLGLKNGGHQRFETFSILASKVPHEVKHAFKKILAV